MTTTPPEFAAAALDHTTQLYQLTLHVNRLRKTVNRLWAWIGALIVIAGVSAAFDHLIPAPELAGRSLVLDGPGARSYTVVPRAEGLGIQISDEGHSRVADLLLRAEGNLVSVEKDGKVIWVSP